MSVNNSWYRKYRPTKLSDMVLSRTMRRYCDGVVERGGLSNPVILYGRPGHGKTTLPGVLINELRIENRKIVVGNDQTGIDFCRNDIFPWLRKELSGKKLLFVDEFDQFSPDAKNWFKGVITTTSSMLMFATNHITSLPEAITGGGRTERICMLPSPDECEEYEKDIIKRLVFILHSEGFKPTRNDVSILARLVKFVPNYCIRDMIVKIQSQMEMIGELTEEIFMSCEDDCTSLLNAIKSKDMTQIKELVMRVDTTKFTTYLMDNCCDIFADKYLFDVGKSIGEYNYMIPAGGDDKVGMWGMCCNLAKNLSIFREV